MSAETDPVAIANNGDGTLGISGYDALSFGARFLHDSDARTQQQAWQRVMSQAVGAFATPTTAVGWEGVDPTYIVCVDDRSTSVELKRFHAARATRSVDLPAGHHPFISHEETSSEILAAAVGAALERTLLDLATAVSDELRGSSTAAPVPNRKNVALAA